MPPHIHAMKTKITTLTKRLIGCAMTLFPVRTFRTIGIRVMMNIMGKSHIMTNNGMGKPSLKFRLFTNSRIMNGSTRSKLMIVGDLRFVRIFFIVSPCVISRICSLTTPAAVSTNIQSMKLNNPLSVCRFRSLHRSLKVCSMDSPSCSLNPRG